MTTSATTTFNLTAQDLIDLALTDLGVFGQGGSNDASLRPHAMKLLNLVLKALDTEGIFTWKVQRRTQLLTSGVASYVLTNDVSDIDEPARYTAAGATYGSQVWSMVRDEYMTLPDRTIQGTPYRYFAEKALDATGIEQITLLLYPVPPNTGDSLEYAAVLRLKDLTSVTQTLDIPQKWMQALRLGLAVALAPSYNTPMDRMGQLRKDYDDAREKAIGDDNERGGLQLVPFGNSNYGYRGGSRAY